MTTISNLKKKNAVGVTIPLDEILTKGDFTRAFRLVMDAFQKLKNQYAEEVKNDKAELSTKTAKALEQMEVKMAKFEALATALQTELKNNTQSEMRLMRKMHNEAMEEMEDMMPEEYDDADIMDKLKALQEAFNSLEIPEKFDATELQKQVNENTDAIEELKKRPVATGSGRVTDVAVQHALMRSVKSETPSGLVNGVNSTYTVSSTIHAVLGFELGSRVISLGTYSITGSYRKTIVFDNPIPANYSDDSFIIIYI